MKSHAVTLLTAGGVIVLILAFVAAWTMSETPNGGPGLGLSVAAILLTAAAVAAIVRWANGNAALPPPEQKENLGLASFILFTVALGALFVALVVGTAQPSYGYYYGRRSEEAVKWETTLRNLRTFHEAVMVGAIVLACLAYLVAAVIGRVALSPGRDGTAPTGWSRARATFAPYPLFLALALATLFLPGALAVGLTAESDTVQKATNEGEIAISLAAGLAVVSLLLGGASLLTRWKPGFLRTVFSPVTAGLAPRHSKGFLIAAEVAAALAAVGVALYSLWN